MPLCSWSRAGQVVSQQRFRGVQDPLPQVAPAAETAGWVDDLFLDFILRARVGAGGKTTARPGWQHHLLQHFRAGEQGVGQRHSGQLHLD